jgi:hypothetical protein
VALGFFAARLTGVFGVYFWRDFFLLAKQHYYYCPTPIVFPMPITMTDWPSDVLSSITE